MPRICKTTPRDENGRPVRIRDLATADAFLLRLFALKADEGSFNRYITVNGYSSAKVVREQPNQGLLKSALADIHVLAERAEQGDPEASKALQLLAEKSSRRAGLTLMALAS